MNKNDKLISMMAVTDEIEERISANKFSGNVGLISELNRLEGYVLQLPSAQPEIIRCKDCKEFRRWIDTDITFCDLTESERDALDFCSRAERREE